MITTALRNLLQFLGYPRLLTEPDGSFAVGALHTRAGTQGPACQLFYPTGTAHKASTQSNKATAPYFRAAAVHGLADYTQQPADLLQFLHHADHPCAFQAPPLPADKGQASDKHPQTFPVVVFSHGLGGCLEMYTTLCQQVASYGYFVVAVEHEEGSGAYAQAATDGTEIYYRRPDDTPYSRQKVLNFRRPFLEQRVKEIQQTLDYLRTYGSHSATTTLLEKVLRGADTEKGVHLLGHSFGGATMVKVAQELNHKDNNLRTISLLDCWAFALDDATLKKGCGTLPAFNILSHAWLTNPETEQVVELLQSHQSSLASYSCPDSVHASFSDASLWFPRWIARRVGILGTKENRYVTIQKVAASVTAHMRDPSLDIPREGLQPFDVVTRSDVQSVP